MQKKIIPCIILDRKNSKGLKSKNIKKLNNLSLIEHSILYAKKSKHISHIVISTDDMKVYKISKKHNCFTIFPRPKKYSQDGSRSEPAIKHALDLFIKAKGKIDIYAYLQVTEPLRPKRILDRCIQNLIKNKKIDSSFAGYTMHKNFWALKKGTFKKLNFSKIDHKPRKNRESIFREDSGIALASRYRLIKKGIRIGKKVKIEPYSGPEGLVDIHDSKDLKIASKIIKNI